MVMMIEVVEVMMVVESPISFGIVQAAQKIKIQEICRNQQLIRNSFLSHQSQKPSHLPALCCDCLCAKL